MCEVVLSSEAYGELYRCHDVNPPFRVVLLLAGPPVDVPSAINVHQCTYKAFALTEMLHYIHIYLCVRFRCHVGSTAN